MSKGIGTLIAIMMVVQGGFFPTIYGTAAVIAIILLAVGRKITFDWKILSGFIVVTGSYVLSAFVNGGDSLAYSAILLTVSYLTGYLLLASYSQQGGIREGIVTGGVIICIIGVFAYMGAGTTDIIRNQRFMGSVQYANVTAFLLGISLLILEEEKIHPEWQKVKPLITVFFFLTISFGGMIGFFLAMGYLVIRKRDKSFATGTILFYGISGMLAATIYMSSFIVKSDALLLGGFVLLAIWSYYWMKLIQRIKGSSVMFLLGGSLFFVYVVTVAYIGGERAAATLVERFIQMKDGMHAWKVNVLFGIGPNQWKEQIGLWRSADYEAALIHNSYVQVAVDAGIGGIAGLCLIIVNWFRKGIKEGNEYQKAAAGFFLLQSFFDMNFYFSSAVWVIMAFCMTREHSLQK